MDGLLVLQSFQRNAYLAVSFAVAGFYDHVTIFPREVQYIWQRPCSILTVLYLLSRYLGDVLLVFYMLVNGPGVTVPRGVSTVLTILDVWGLLASTALMQVIMQLRVYAMYERRRKVLVLLCVCFLLEIIVAITILCYNFGPGSPDTVEYHIDGTLTCFNNGTNGFSGAAFAPFLCAELLLFILAMRKAIVHLKATKHISGGRKLSSMMSALVRDSVLYFFGNIISVGIFAGLFTNLFGSNIQQVSVPFMLLMNSATSSHLILGIRHIRDSSEGLAVEGQTGRAKHESTVIDRLLQVAAGRKQDAFDPCLIYDIGAAP
ncbi:hypothetical protein M405DRAFT_79585 [Rhizopogon salebrosus TDB-379]|nr:hypothetical protein M405DRAFT_79585 [Rhizopogon salebrosus TDB-379]